ncbi:hypothetical protein RYX36_029399 [Vicia faba]
MEVNMQWSCIRDNEEHVELRRSGGVLMMMLKSLLLIEPEGDGFSALFKSMFPILKAELEYLVNGGDVLLDGFNSKMLRSALMSAESSGNQLDDSKIKDLFVFFASSNSNMHSTNTSVS